MPYDGTNFEVKPDLSLDGLIEWLEGQEPETVYDYLDTDRDGPGCLLMRWHRACGRHPHAESFPLYEGIFNDLHAVAMGKPHTYGAALSRARALRGA